MARDIVKPHRTNHVRRARKIVTRSAAARAEGTGGNLPDAPHSEPDNMSTDSEGGVLLEVRPRQRYYRTMVTDVCLDSHALTSFER